MSKRVDKYVVDFCNDCLNVLQEYDVKLRKNLLDSEFKIFYKYDSKGLAVYSITEPILKFLIFSSLCYKYQIWPESSFYKGKQLLDIALFTRRINNIDKEIEPDVAIEMKWAAVKKSGEFNKWSLKSLIDDILKLHKESETQNKYVMQFLVLHSDTQEIDNKVLEEQVFAGIDKRKFKSKDVKILFNKCFDTKGKDEKEKWKFYILLWGIK